MKKIEGVLRDYAWGSRQALAALTGRAYPTEQPEAELWFGAHVAAPSPLATREESAETPTHGTLRDVIAADPARELGEDITSAELPFLLKILAADQALSIQAHPSKEQAELGFARENAAGVPLDAFDRNYKDDNHKPELLVALTPFEALAGFRPVAQTVEFLERVGCGALREFFLELLDTSAAECAGTGSEGGAGNAAVSTDEQRLQALLREVLTLPVERVEFFVAELIRACRDYLAAQDEHTGAALTDTMQGAQTHADAQGAQWTDAAVAQTARALCEIEAQYPGDRGVLSALLLNYMQLSPGQGLFLKAGQLHAYVRGVGVEVMANSDNVLRGGLTSKHMDVPELLRLVDYVPQVNPVLDVPADEVYRVPVSEFRLRHIPAEVGEVAEPVCGPAIILAVAAQVEVRAVGEPERAKEVLSSGQAVWLSAGEYAQLSVHDAELPTPCDGAAPRAEEPLPPTERRDSQLESSLLTAGGAFIVQLGD